MNRPSFDATGIQFAWNASTLKVAEDCLRKYQLQVLEGWTRPGRSVHLLFGGIYASALELYHKRVALGDTPEDALGAAVLHSLTESWDSETSAPLEFDHAAKTRENLIRTIVWYLDQFGPNDPCQTLILSGKPAVEQTFALDVDDGQVFCGHIDRIVEYEGAHYVTDNKTTGSTISGQFFNQFNPDTQMSMYTFAGKAVFQTPLKGVMIDGAQIAVGFSRFERGFSFRTDGMLNEWYDNTMWRIRQVRTATRENYFPMNPSACDKFGGCQFRAICSRTPEIREQFLKGDFEKQPYRDPLEIR